MSTYKPLQQAFLKITTPFENFIHNQTTTGIVLLFATILALILANSPFADAYHHFFETKIGFSIGSWKVYHTLHHWINDGLMAIFFFVVGLEIKRELLVGELSEVRLAILPILAAIGGMIAPALIYLSINFGTPAQNGWGIPMATDIAFAISVLVLLGKRVPPSLVTFLVALAIVDDLGAVMVIALFYTGDLNILALLYSMGFFVSMIFLNLIGVRNYLSYFILAAGMWFFMLDSGIHATIAGVLAALAIPSKPQSNPLHFTQKVRNLLDDFDKFPIATDMTMHERQKAILQNIKDRIDSISSPAGVLEHTLHLPVSLLIIPLFAFANAGIRVDVTTLHEMLTTPVAMGVMAGLFFGKVIGIFGFSYLAIKLGIAKPPQGSALKQIFAVSFLGGIGFTMSIFISDLAFEGNQLYITEAKSAILIVSMIAGLLGYLMLRTLSNKNS